MSKLSQHQIRLNLIEIYGSDTTVRDCMIPQIRAEVEREQTLLGLPPVDWNRLHLPDSLKETDIEAYFFRLMMVYFSNKGDKWLRELYRNNIHANA